MEFDGAGGNVIIVHQLQYNMAKNSHVVDHTNIELGTQSYTRGPDIGNHPPWSCLSKLTQKSVLRDGWPGTRAISRCSEVRGTALRSNMSCIVPGN